MVLVAARRERAMMRLRILNIGLERAGRGAGAPARAPDRRHARLRQQDQVRIATAVSEVARGALPAWRRRPPDVQRDRRRRRQVLEFVLQDQRAAAGVQGALLDDAIVTAHRLMDDVRRQGCRRRADDHAVQGLPRRRTVGPADAWPRSAQLASTAGRQRPTPRCRAEPRTGRPWPSCASARKTCWR
jgi:hypothetical protein